MTNSQHLQQLLNEIAELTEQSTTEDQALKNNHKQYLSLEYNAAYGGWRLNNVHVGSGGHSGAFGGNSTEARLKYKEMVIKLDGIIQGIKYVKQLTAKKQ
jgi:hypothetical protein